MATLGFCSWCLFARTNKHTQAVRLAASSVPAEAAVLKVHVLVIVEAKVCRAGRDGVVVVEVKDVLYVQVVTSLKLSRLGAVLRAPTAQGQTKKVLRDEPMKYANNEHALFCREEKKKCTWQRLS